MEYLHFNLYSDKFNYRLTIIRLMSSLFLMVQHLAIHPLLIAIQFEGDFLQYFLNKLIKTLGFAVLMRTNKHLVPL